MILILADAGDIGALWLEAALQRVMTLPVVLLTPARLVYARTIVQHLSSGGGSSRFTLADGSLLDFADVTGVVNRVTAAPTDHFAHAAEGDRDYALVELHAFLIGWLASLECPVINPPSPESLAGPWHTDVCAIHFAALAGLAVPPSEVSAERVLPRSTTGTSSHVVLDDQVIGPLLPLAVRDAMIHFARLWGGRMVQIHTDDDGEVPNFRGASSLVDPQRGGAPVVRALVRALAA